MSADEFWFVVAGVVSDGDHGSGGGVGVPADPWGLGSPRASAGLEGVAVQKSLGLRPGGEFTSLEEGGCVILFWFCVASIGGKPLFWFGEASVAGDENRIGSSNSSNWFDGVVGD